MTTIQRVGHIVIKMRDLEKAKQFYCGVLGMKVAHENERSLFMRFDEYHHDIAVLKTASEEADLPKKDQVGLMHIGLLAEDLHAVRRIYDRCKEAGVDIIHARDHGTTKSLYVHDPEGNEVEIYSDAPNWRELGNGLPGVVLFDIEAVPPYPVEASVAAAH